MKLGIIARCDDTGLGNQTKELVDMLDPDIIILIDFRDYKDNEQFLNRYDGKNVIINRGFLSDDFVNSITKNIDVLISCEIFYNDNLVSIAKQNNCKTILQYNYELLPTFNDKFPLPDVLLSPSMWHISNIQRLVRGKETIVQYLPPPIYPQKFENNVKVNSVDHNRVLHIHGTGAAFDRNGTDAVINMMKHSRQDYELVVKTQVGYEPLYKDSRIIIDHSNEKNSADLYSGYDMLLMPRKYGGLCLPMNEALLSGLPVFMTNVEPNNFILPKSWLVETSGFTPVQTKNKVMAARPGVISMAKVVDKYMSSNKEEAKRSAYDIGYRNFSPQVLKDQYIKLINCL